MREYPFLDLPAPLPLVSDRVLLGVFDDCTSYLKGGETCGHIQHGAARSEVEAARIAVEMELHQRGIGGPAWWESARTREDRARTRSRRRLSVNVPRNTTVFPVQPSPLAL